MDELGRICKNDFLEYLMSGIPLKGADVKALSNFEQVVEEYCKLYESELRERDLGYQDILNQNTRFIYFLKVQYLVNKVEDL